MKNKWETKQSDELFQAILKLENISEAKKFFRDLLTEEEIKEFSARWKVARMLSKKISYIKIEKETGMSSTTIARVSKWLNRGMNGYKLILQRIHHTTQTRLREV
jgi:TrpR-related protein YerC/YecD